MKRPPSPPYPRPSSPVVLVPPLKKRRKTVSFSTSESDSKPQLPSAPPSPSPSQVAADSLLLSPSRPADSPVPASPARSAHGIQLLPFASKPGEGNALIVPPPPGRAQDGEESKKAAALVSPQAGPAKSPAKRGKDSPKSPAGPVMVCRTVQNLPLDHASMCRMAFEEAPAPAGKRSRGRPRTTSLSTSSLREDEDEDEGEQRLRLREQLGATGLLQLASASTADLSVLADVALKMDPDAGDSEETETSDEAEEQKMEEGLAAGEPLGLALSPEGVLVLTEHNYCKPPLVAVPAAAKRTSSKHDASVLLPADLNAISGVLEAPEEVIGEAPAGRGDTGEYGPTLGVLCPADDSAPASKRSAAGRGMDLDKENKKKRRKDKENLEIQHTKKTKEPPGKKQKKRKLEVRSDFSSAFVK